ncbi:NYN domain-containing protein [Duganella sp. FT92W]|uniref:NYN domain-containing protein n=1 Tax=Pseudoduganella rivuli TaxID=2666085 RepID=A0A7X2INA4_9BURK|nr:NYN domain-containing protein [Pseudoduganella rivuli]MRV73015.1 NYN domain-containing protein [Pseudoduganella rivuli]
MASSNDNVSMALFCDFENVALGVRDANYEKFDIKPVLERLLLKGSIVVKKSYCDWDRYKGFKSAMHEANFELIEIPHVRQSGKNSADIRMVVDALDLCYTKSHVNTFVIISGDSDFSPLVSKLRENAKKVIGVGVKQSTSDLLVANCDEFIFYDDLVRERRRADAAKRDTREGQGAKRTPEEEKRRREEMDKRRTQAVEMAVETFDALVAERGDSGKIWASVLKEAIKRRKPDFSESYYGFRTFGNLLEEARARGFLEFGRDEKSGAYVYRSSGVPVLGADGAAAVVSADGVTPGAPATPAAPGEAADGAQGRHEGGRRGRNRGRDRRPFPNAGRINEETPSDLQLAQDENAYAAAEAEHAADDAVFVAHPEDAGQEQGGMAADEAAIDVDLAQTAAQAAEQGKRKQPKLPARAAKAAKMKAQQAAAKGETPAAPEPVAPAEPATVSDVTVAVVADVAAETAAQDAAESAQAAEAPEAGAAKAGKGRGRTPAKGRGGKGTARGAKPEATGQAAAQPAPDAQHAPAAQSAPAAMVDAVAPSQEASAPAEGADAAAKPARKPSSRGPRRPRKPDAKQGS